MLSKNHLALPTPCLALALLSCVLLGCDAQIDQFDANDVYGLTVAKSRETPASAAVHDSAMVVSELFGSPEQPIWPDAILKFNLVDPEHLSRAAGAVSSNRDGTNRGIYRKHCVICHALPGSGAGPASLFQNPYPRDFRRGVFKWKSTERAAKPIRQNLTDLLAHGIPGSAMPSFALLAVDDREALTDYAIYLSIRGEVERALIAAAIDDLGYEESSPADSKLSTDSKSEGGQLVYQLLDEVAASWTGADRNVVQVPKWSPLRGELQMASIQRGKAIFHGQIANCVSCHGPSGNGSAITLDYDDWTKEFSTMIGLTPTDREAMRPFRKAGALKPRQIKARNLQDGVFHGGGDPETLFRRITQGIAGTPMPAVQWVDSENGMGLTSEQIWDLVRYVRSLSSGSKTATANPVDPILSAGDAT